MTLSEDLRAAVSEIRRRPFPISDLVPLLTKAADTADAADSLRAFIQKLISKCRTCAGHGTLWQDPCADLPRKTCPDCAEMRGVLNRPGLASDRANAVETTLMPDRWRRRLMSLAGDITVARMAFNEGSSTYRMLSLSLDSIGKWLVEKPPAAETSANDDGFAKGEQ